MKKQSPGYDLHEKSHYQDQIAVLLRDFDFVRVKLIKDLLQQAYPSETTHNSSIEHLKKTASDMLHITATVCDGPNSREGFQGYRDYNGMLALRFVVEEREAGDFVDWS